MNITHLQQKNMIYYYYVRIVEQKNLNINYFIAQWKKIRIMYKTFCYEFHRNVYYTVVVWVAFYNVVIFSIYNASLKCLLSFEPISDVREKSSDGFYGVLWLKKTSLTILIYILLLLVLICVSYADIWRDKKVANKNICFTPK